MSEIPEDCVFPRSMFDRIVSWKESWLRDGDQTRRLKMANQIVGVLPRIIRHIRHIESRIGTQFERIAAAEAQVAELQAQIDALRSENQRLRAPVSDEEEGVANILCEVHGFRYAFVNMQSARAEAPQEKP